MEKINNFDKFNENLGMTYTEVFNKYIKGQKIKGVYSGTPVHTDGSELYHSVSGVLLENGWAYASHGGGCSGEDCNENYLISKKGKILATQKW